MRPWVEESAMVDEDQGPEQEHPMGGKKPYERPRIVSKEPLEAVAGVCVRMDAGMCGTFAPSGS